MNALRRHHIVSRLGSAVVTYNDAGLGLSNEKVREQTFTGVAESKINDNIGAQFEILSLVKHNFSIRF